MQKDVLNSRFQNFIYMLLFQYGFTIDNNFVTFDRNHLTGIFINEIFNPCFQDTCSQFTAQHFLQICLVNLHIFCKVENLKNIFVVLEADRTQQSSYRQFLLTVNVCVHHVIDVSSKLNPRTFKRNNTSRIKFRTIGMHTLTEEYTRRTVKL